MKILESGHFGTSKLITELAKNPERNLYAISNVTRDPNNTKLYACFQNERLLGYLLLYSGLSHPTAILETEMEEPASRLIDLVPWEHFVIFVPPEIMPAVTEKFDVTWSCVEQVLTVTRSSFVPAASRFHPVRLKRSEAKKVLDFYPAQSAGSRSLEGYQKWLGNNTVYGIFTDERLVCVAGTYVEHEYAWILGALFTDMAYRRRGLGTAITSALTQEALKHSPKAMTYVVSTNQPSLRILDKLGFGRAYETIFADIGTGIRPLTN